jgi:CheY-like chemotaxis protein
MVKNLIICDDEPHILRAAELKFQRAGFTVRCAQDGQEAWELILAGHPDLVITDCQMPRMTGIQLAQLIHDTPETTRIPVIMLTGKGFELSHEELRRRFNILAVLNKPFSPRDLLRKVESLLGIDCAPTETQAAIRAT